MNIINSLKNTRNIYIALITIAVLLGSSIGLVTVSAQTSAFTVNSANDVIDINPGDGVCETSTSGECTLRAAIMEANALSGDDTIILPAGNYVMTDQAPEETQFSISSNLIIQGEGRDITIIDANELDRVFHVSGQVDVTMIGITIQGGLRASPPFGDSTGGGIQTEISSNLSLTDCIVRNNTSGVNSTVYNFSGGGISNNGTLTLNNSIVSNNNSLGLGFGGGIASAGVMIINNSSITDNYAASWGGGIYNAGSLTINDSIIQDNTSEDGGGGIWNVGILTLNSTNINNNLSQGYNGGGGITNDSGTVVLNNSTIAGNSAERGGGIRNLGQPNTNGIYGILIIDDSLIQGNVSSSDGGGIWNSGTLTTVNSNISDNSNQGGLGGGIYNDGFVQNSIPSPGAIDLTNTAITGNSAAIGGGIYSFYGTGTIIDSTINGNSANSNSECGGGVASWRGEFTITGSVINFNVCSAYGAGGGIMNTGDLVMNNTSIQGNIAGSGGGLYNNPYISDFSATLTNVQITGNSAQSAGGVFNMNNINIKDSTISNNITDFAGQGGGLFNYVGSNIEIHQVFENVAFSGNIAYEGGGIYAVGLPSALSNGIELINVMFDGNHASQHGGALMSFDGEITIIGSTFLGNTVGDGASGDGNGGNIYSYGGKVHLFNSSLDDNHNCHSTGGNPIFLVAESIFSATDSAFHGSGCAGIDNRSTAMIVRSNFIGFPIDNSGSLTVSESTFSDSLESGSSYGYIAAIKNTTSALYVTSSTFTNNATGIWNGSPYGSITNSTFLGNSTAISQPNGGELDISNSTFSLNFTAILSYSGYPSTAISNSTFDGGRFNGYFVIKNSIITSESCNYAETTIIDGGNNIETGEDCGFSASIGSINNTDPLLSPLGDFGGPTQTFALLPGSPAIDAGDNTNCTSTDQRGVSRPLDGDGDTNAVCDIGAYEFENTPTGLNIAVQLEGAGTGTSPVEMTFTEITQSGTTSLVTSAAGPIIPSGFSLGNSPTYYDISTTATFSSVIIVCISYTPEEYTNANNLHLLLYENDAWADVTTSNDTNNLVVCGQASSLSSFTIAETVPTASNATITINVHTGDLPGNGQQNYLVRVYHVGGSQVTTSYTDTQGNAVFTLNNNAYEYSIEKNGAVSSRQQFQVAGLPQTLNYRLAVVNVKVSDNAGGSHQNYLVRVYNGANGSGSQWGTGWTDANGEAVFYLIEGQYGYLIEKNGAKSGKVDFTVTTAQDSSLEYKLAKVTVKVSDNAGGAHQNYLVRVYNEANGLGSQWGTGWTDANGEAVFYLVEGQYGYLIEKNSAISSKVGLTVTTAQDSSLEYKLAKVTVKVSDNAGGLHQNYLVRVYNGTNGSGSQWGTGWTAANGEAVFYLVEGQYGYLIEKNGAKSGKVGFTITTTQDSSLEYKLAKVIVHVQNSSGNALNNYLVRLYNYPASSQWGTGWTNTNEDSTFFLIEGNYQYSVEKNTYNSGKQPVGGFAITYGSDATKNWSVP